MKKKLEEMLKLQDRINSISSHENWRDGITLTGKVINWKRCMYMELAEAIDSISWKHWKNIEGGINRNNFNVELIDIWHFLMSYLLTQNTIDETCELILKNLDGNISEYKLPSELNKDNNLMIDKILKPYEDFMSLCLENQDDIDYRIELIKIFFTCLDSASIPFDDLYKLYIGKNVLNKFRQDNGYKNGTYKKIWNGKEDNVFMQEIIDNITGFDNIYSKLSEIYKNIK